MEFTQGAPFDSFGLSEATMRAIRNKGYEISTPVQAGCIPPMLAGKDVIAKAPTGTGKTMAFGIPIIERIDPDSEDVQAVILAPTRELAIQITDEIRDLAAFKPGSAASATSASPANAPPALRRRKPRKRPFWSCSATTLSIPGKSSLHSDPIRHKSPSSCAN